MFIYFFFSSVKILYCNSRENKHQLLYRAWRHRFFGSPLGGEAKKKCIWDFCLQWFKFYRNGFRRLAQGERSLGSGRFRENKGRLTFVSENRASEAGYESVFICLSWWKFMIALFSFHLSLPTSHCTIPPLSLTKLLFPPTHPPDLWQWGIYTAQAQVQTHLHNPQNNLLSCWGVDAVLAVSFTTSAPYLFLHIPSLLHPIFYNFSCFLAFSVFYLSQFYFPTCSAALWHPPLARGHKLKDQWMSVSLHFWATHLHAPVLIHTYGPKCGPGAERMNPKKYHLGRKCPIWKVDCASARAPLHTLVTLTKRGKELMAILHMYIHMQIYTHSRRCMLFKYGKQWLRGRQ